MKKTVIRAVAATLLAGAAVLGAAAPALAAAQDGVVVVDEPDTTNLTNIWTFAPLGVPVLGAIQSLNGVPGRILPAG
ncbi:hypothetical protein [Amycolatopsis jejuensis]|uniref:hypothetical protein n=1 Tax=Amycolatopsis jejuensis TaxID=330084 RepID=UPI0005270161|nr:hypothetical protein [Amycolatopsis jejuensis]